MRVPPVRTVGDLPGPDEAADPVRLLRVAPGPPRVLAEPALPRLALLLHQVLERVAPVVAHGERHHHQAAGLALPELPDLLQLVLPHAADAGRAARADVDRPAGDDPGKPGPAVADHGGDAARQDGQPAVFKALEARHRAQCLPEEEGRVAGRRVRSGVNLRPRLAAAEMRRQLGPPRTVRSRRTAGDSGVGCRGFGHCGARLQAADLHVRSSRGITKAATLFGTGRCRRDGRGGPGRKGFALGNGTLRPLLAGVGAVHTRPFPGRVSDRGPAGAPGPCEALRGPLRASGGRDGGG
ncbi:hypothetical protein EES40_36915 [Streptomyces sp. ADI93-02]|nr:hypothetical protein EES40_36915 [Streptomyces sp. ADI93-02]